MYRSTIGAKNMCTGFAKSFAFMFVVVLVYVLCVWVYLCCWYLCLRLHGVAAEWNRRQDLHWMQLHACSFECVQCMVQICSWCSWSHLGWGVLIYFKLIMVVHFEQAALLGTAWSNDDAVNVLAKNHALVRVPAKKKISRSNLHYVFVFACDNPSNLLWWNLCFFQPYVFVTKVPSKKMQSKLDML